MQRGAQSRGRAALAIGLLLCLFAVVAPHAQAATTHHPHRHGVVTAVAGAATAPDHGSGRGDHAVAGTVAPATHRLGARYADAAGHPGTDSQFTVATVPARGPPANAR
jgi:hypothetical protein